MDLELVPIDGKTDLTAEEKKQRKKRSKRIQPELLEQFTSKDEVEIKQFLVNLTILLDEYHHEMAQDQFLEGHQERLEKLNERRFALFQDLSDPLCRFVKLLDLAPVESSEEVEILVKELRNDELREHYKIQLETGIELATDNPFLMQMDQDLEVEHKDLEIKTRATPSEIEALIIHFPLEVIVNTLINARKMTTGEFWQDLHYDL